MLECDLVLVMEKSSFTNVEYTWVSQFDRLLLQEIFRDHLKGDHIPSFPKLLPLLEGRDLCLNSSKGEEEWRNLDDMDI
jgi:hypothetical protein